VPDRMRTTATESYTVGALAEASGLTVRTLHHWDEIGLLQPAERSAAGHRRYSPDDVRRLYRIVALRGLGLSLEQVGEALEREGPDLRAAVAAHLVRVEEELAHARDLRRRLRGILDAFDRMGEPSTDQIIDAIEVMTMSEQYYTPEQLEQLDARARELGEEGMAKAQQDWADLMAEMDAERRAGTDPADPKVQALADRWQALIDAFTGGDPGIRASLQRMYDEEGPEKASRGMVDPALMEYAGRAISLRGENRS
jgi:MerR family transcriptional regulator, thiopeptide resistance regulator